MENVKKEIFMFSTHYKIKNAIALAQLSAEIYNHTNKDTNIEELFKSTYQVDDAVFFSANNKKGCPTVDLQFAILKKDNDIVIVFKGSDEKGDWLTNINVKKEKLKNTNVDVHSGFINSFELFIQTIKDSDRSIDGIKISEIYNELVNQKSKYNITITGHSLGGAIATVLTAYLSDKKNLVCYTFGAPPVGWEKFYNSYKNINLFRIVNELDPVPNVNKWTSNISSKMIPVSSAWKSLFHIGELKLLESDEQEHHLSKHYITNLQKENKRTLKRNKLLSINDLVMKYRWVAFLSLMVIITLIFGLIGYMDAGYTSIDSIYLAVDQLTLDFAEKKNLNLSLEISRFSALVFVSSAILRGVYLFFYNSLFKPFLLSKNDKHIVIFGFNGHVQELIKNINKEQKDTEVIIVTSKEFDTHQLGLKATTVLLPKQLTVKFMRMLKLENAKHIVCIEMEDSLDITHANGVIEYLNDKEEVQDVQLHIHLHSYTLADLFNHENYVAVLGKMPCNIKVFNHYENAVRVLFRNVPMEDESILRERTTHWLISGEWNQKISLMRYVAQMAYYEDEALPSITLVCEDIKESKKEIDKLFPKIEKTATINIVNSLNAQLETPVTHIAVLYEDDVKGLEEALVFSNIYKDELIFLQQRDDSIINNRQIIVFGSFNTLNNPDIIFDEVLDERAKNIHHYYIEMGKKEGWTMEPWEELSLFKKNSNRMQAEHISIKLRGIGWKDENDFTGYKEFLNINPDLVQKWARIEHLRWNAFHYVNGWDFSEDRDDSKKLHNCLVPFEELTKKEQIKDEPALLEIPTFTTTNTNKDNNNE